MQHVSQILHRMGQSHWLKTSSQAGAQPVQLCAYTLAHKRGDELMWSMAHKRSKSVYGPSLHVFVGMRAASHGDGFEGLTHSRSAGQSIICTRACLFGATS